MNFKCQGRNFILFHFFFTAWSIYFVCFNWQFEINIRFVFLEYVEVCSKGFWFFIAFQSSEEDSRNHQTTSQLRYQTKQLLSVSTLDAIGLRASLITFFQSFHKMLQNFIIAQSNFDYFLLLKWKSRTSLRSKLREAMDNNWSVQPAK